MSVQAWREPVGHGGERVGASMVRRKVLTALVLVLPLGLGILTHLICAAHLPDRLPDPWDLPGVYPAGTSVDSNAVYGAFMSSGLTVVASLVLTIRSKGSRRSRLWIAGLASASAMSMFSWMLVQVVAYGAPTLADVSVSLWHHALLGVPLAAYGALLLSVLPIAPQPTTAPVASRLALEPGVRVLWAGRATSRFRLWVGLASLGASVVGVVVSPPIGALMLIWAGGALFNSVAKVRIDNLGVTVSRGIGWRGRRLPLERLASARSQSITRSSMWWDLDVIDRDVRSLIIRPGRALVVEGTDHLPLYVSVDHADEAADVINALVARSRAVA